MSDMDYIPPGCWLGAIPKSGSTLQQAFSSPDAEFDVAQQLKNINKFV